MITGLVPWTLGAPRGEGRSQRDDVITERIEAFRLSDPKERWEAIERVASVGDRAVPLLIKHFRSTQNPVELRACFFAWERIGTPQAAQAAWSQYDPDELTDDALAVGALVFGRLGLAEAQPTLRDAAGSRRPSVFRLAATLALGRMGDVSGLRPILEDVRKESIEQQRVAVLVAAAVTRDRLLLPLVMPALKDRSIDGRRAAVAAIAEIGDPSALPVLLDGARHEKSDEVLLVYALALGRMEDRASREQLLRWTRAKDAALRETAWVSLGARPDAAEEVAAALRDLDDKEQLRSLALACASPNAAVVVQAELERLLGSRHAAVRSAAGLALATVGGGNARDAILAWLRREEERRDDALLVVGVLGLTQALDFLEVGQTEDDAPMTAAVRRTLTGWRDVRLMRDELTGRLRAAGARLVDRREALLAALLGRVFQLDKVDRRLPPSGGGDDGDGFPKSRIDPRNTSLERDLLEWTDRAPYFSPPPGSRL